MGSIAERQVMGKDEQIRIVVKKKPAGPVASLNGTGTCSIFREFKSGISMCIPYEFKSRMKQIYTWDHFNLAFAERLTSSLH